MESTMCGGFLSWILVLAKGFNGHTCWWACITQSLWLCLENGIKRVGNGYYFQFWYFPYLDRLGMGYAIMLDWGVDRLPGEITKLPSPFWPFYNLLIHLPQLKASNLRLLFGVSSWQQSTEILAWDEGPRRWWGACIYYVIVGCIWMFYHLL